MDREGFLHNGRIVYSVQYELVGGSSIIVWFDRAGNDLNGRVCHSEPGRAIITTNPGDVIFYAGQPRTVVSLAPHRQNWLDPAERVNHWHREANAADSPPT
jgi:hypothetical protein